MSNMFPNSRYDVATSQTRYMQESTKESINLRHTRAIWTNSTLRTSSSRQHEITQREEFFRFDTPIRLTCSKF